RVLYIQIIIAGNDGLHWHFPTYFTFFSIIPPFFYGVKFLNADGFGFAVGFSTFGQSMFVIPNFFGWLAFFKENQVGVYGGIRSKYTLGQSHNGMHVA